MVSSEQNDDVRGFYMGNNFIEFISVRSKAPVVVPKDKIVYISQGFGDEALTTTVIYLNYYYMIGNDHCQKHITVEGNISDIKLLLNKE